MRNISFVLHFNISLLLVLAAQTTDCSQKKTLSEKQIAVQKKTIKRETKRLRDFLFFNHSPRKDDPFAIPKKIMNDAAHCYIENNEEKTLSNLSVVISDFVPSEDINAVKGNMPQAAENWSKKTTTNPTNIKLKSIATLYAQEPYFFAQMCHRFILKKKEDDFFI